MIFPFTVADPDLIKVSASLREQIPEFAMYLFKRISSESLTLLEVALFLLKSFIFCGCGLKFLSLDFPLKDPVYQGKSRNYYYKKNTYRFEVPLLQQSH